MTEKAQVERRLQNLIEERDTARQITSIIYWGDNLNVLKALPQNSVDLIYLDPPFSPDKKYWFIWGENDEAVMKAYKEACSGGRQTYVNWMHERVELMHRVLKETGSFYFHCDPQLGHYFKSMLDDVFKNKDFGYDKFKNEIVWAYQTGGRAENHFSRKHDTIFFYTKSDNYTFNSDAIRLKRKLNSHLRKGIDEQGRRYGEITNRKTGKVYRYYEDEGIIPTDVWIDINVPHQLDPERTGYVTQKPEALLERIIKASSNPGDIVLDPFCGCGTAPEAAYKLNRKWIGIDLAEKGCRTTKRRLEELKASYCLFPWDLEEKQLKELENLSGNEFRDWIVLRIQGIPRRGIDGGIDLYTNKRAPVQAKKIKTSVGPGVLRDFKSALRNEGKNKGYIVSFYGFTKGAIEEANRAKEEGLEIELVKVEDIPRFFD